MKYLKEKRRHDKTARERLNQCGRMGFGKKSYLRANHYKSVKQTLILFEAYHSLNDFFEQSSLQAFAYGVLVLK